MSQPYLTAAADAILPLLNNCHMNFSIVLIFCCKVLIFCHSRDYWCRVPTGGPNFGARVLIRTFWPKGSKLAPKKALGSKLAPNWLQKRPLAPKLGATHRLWATALPRPPERPGGGGVVILISIYPYPLFTAAIALTTTPVGEIKLSDFIIGGLLEAGGQGDQAGGWSHGQGKGGG